MTDSLSPSFEPDDLRTSVALSGKTTPEAFSMEQEFPLTPSLRQRRKPESPLDDYRFSQDPVHAFLCGSQEIKEDLQRLASQAPDLPSPSFTPLPPTPSQAPDSNIRLYRSGEVRSRKTWERVNTLLTQQGYEEVLISEGPAMEDVGEVLLTVLRDYTRCQSDLKAAQTALETSLKDLEVLKDSHKRLRSKLSHEHAKAKHRIHALQASLQASEDQVQDLEEEKRRGLRESLETKEDTGSEHDRLVFAKHFGREARSLMDSKVLRLIHFYEAGSLNSSHAEISQLRREKAYLEERLGTVDSESVETVLRQLGLRSAGELPGAVGKMQQVIRALPGLEGFIKRVLEEVLGPLQEARAVEEVIPTLRTWKQRLSCFDALHSLYIRLLGSPHTLDDSQLLSAVETALYGLSHFRSLFSVAPSVSTLTAMDQVFLFVHEMKALLQFCRKTLELDGDWPLTRQMEAIKQALLAKSCG